MGTPIPEGYELLAGRSRVNATKAIDLATERGFDSSTVRVSTVHNGYLIPTNEERPESTESTDENTGGENTGDGAPEGNPEGETPDVDLAVVTTESVEVPTDKNTVAEIDKFAGDWGIAAGDGTKAEKVAAINAEIERRTKIAEETGVLVGASENTEDKGE